MAQYLASQRIEGPLAFGRIPLEILSSIFEQFCSQSHILNLRSQLILMHVCFVWRNAAQSTPAIWARQAFRQYWHKFVEYRAMIQDWIHYSGDLPMDVELTIVLSSRDDNPSTESVQRTLESVFPCLCRLRALKFEASLRFVLPLLRLPPASIPLLQALELRMKPDVLLSESWVRDTGLSTQAIHTLLGSHQLQSVSIKETYKFNLLDNLSLPAEQLTTFQYTFPLPVLPFNPRTHLDILSRSKNLVHCRLELSYFSLDVSEVPLSISLSKLRSLYISFRSFTIEPHVLLFIHRLTAPCLTEFRCFSRNGYTSALAQELLGFQHRSAAPLARLQLNGFKGATDDLVSILRLFPDIESVVFSDIRFNLIPLVHALLCREGQDNLVPNAQELVLGCYDDTRPNVSEEELRSVVEMIESRWRPNLEDDTRRSLKKVKVHMSGLPSTLDEEGLRRLRVCERQGLDVDVEV